MQIKEFYTSPVTEVFQTLAAVSILNGSDFENGGIENPIDYGDWV